MPTPPIQPNSESSSVPEPQKSREQIIYQAEKMAVEGRSGAQIRAYLIKQGVSPEESGHLAKEIVGHHMPPIEMVANQESGEGEGIRSFMTELIVGLGVLLLGGLYAGVGGCG